MKLSWLGLTTIGFVIVAVIVRLLNISEVSNWAIRIGPILVLAMLVIISFIVYKANERRGTREKYVWLTIFIASIFNLIGGVTELLPVLTKTTGEIYMIVANIVFLLAYIGFIVGLALANYQFRGMKKINPWPPIIATLIAFVIGLFFLSRLMAASNTEVILQISFIIFLVFDALLVLLAWMLARRTWGGSLSNSYVTIAFACIGLAGFHIMAIVSSIHGNFTVDSLIRVIFVIVLGLLAVGGDIRLSIEKRLEI